MGSTFGAIWEDPEGGFIKFMVKRALKQDQTLYMEGKLHIILYFREECNIILTMILSTEQESGNSDLIVMHRKCVSFSELSMGELAIIELAGESSCKLFFSWLSEELVEEFSLSRMPSKIESRVSRPTIPTSGIRMSMWFKKEQMWAPLLLPTFLTYKIPKLNLAYLKKMFTFCKCEKFILQFFFVYKKNCHLK